MSQQTTTPRPLALIILDGWGYSDDPRHNAIHAALKPNWDHLWKDYPHALIQGSGNYVGLPADQMGNSEVGHLNIGAGRVVYQEISRIDRAIASGEFQANPVFNAALTKAAAGASVHILGLLSPGGVHSHQEHIHTMIRMAVAKVGARVYLHAFLDGRDTPPKSAAGYLDDAEQVFRSAGGGRVASVVGRYYAMDRDRRWERTRAAYDMITLGRADYRAETARQALESAYARAETDEFVRPTLVAPRDGPPVRIEDGDVVLFMNFRADRARQLTRAFCDDSFDGFERAARPRLGEFVSLTDYSKEFANPVAFPASSISNGFGEYISGLGLRQLRIAETEKYAHVTFFFNGGEEREFAGEERILVPSPKVATYDLKPEMSAHEVTDRLVAAIESGRFDVIICNYANADMVGHTGNFAAAVRAIETIDACLGRVHGALRRAGGEMIVTADHGNAEQMSDDATGQAHTAHTTNPVPFVYVGRPARIAHQGALSDIAPTMLYLMGIDPPSEMSGRSMVELTRD